MLMNIDFAAVLVVLTVLTGGIWLLDTLVLAPRRTRNLTVGDSNPAWSAAEKLPPCLEITLLTKLKVSLQMPFPLSIFGEI